MYYDVDGKKVKVSGFSMGGVSEGYSGKIPTYAWWVLIALGVVSVILFVFWMLTKDKKKAKIGFY